MSDRIYILYDGRAATGDTEGATIFVVCDSEEEAQSYKDDFGQSCCYSYRKQDNKLTDERHEWNHYPE